jgi:very-short-patch-repair endonuclease
MERNKNLTTLSQNLRKNQTKEEQKLWYQFLRKYPVQFRRQFVIGEYIADFYCHKAKIVIELDGSGHYEPEQIQKDRLRTNYLEAQGLQVLRFTNTDVQRNFYSVCEEIDKRVKERC